MGMRLNHVPAGDAGGGTSGSGPVLASSSSEKLAAANAIDFTIKGATGNAGKFADVDTDAVVKAFAAGDGDGWLTSTAVKKAHSTWVDQSSNLVAMLTSDANALRQNSGTLYTGDVETASGVGKRSALDLISPQSDH
ncbi:hypothetical protein ABZ845_04535 [Streptomyces sp. NPDC047022]|uniref:hypothetical protein n=1 Tax=Streptomyces sp. NPDC047022 TaxID=3155737 RepID=UPI0033E45F77